MFDFFFSVNIFVGYVEQCVVCMYVGDYELVGDDVGCQEFFVVDDEFFEVWIDVGEVYVDVVFGGVCFLKFEEGFVFGGGYVSDFCQGGSIGSFVVDGLNVDGDVGVGGLNGFFDVEVLDQLVFENCNVVFIVFWVFWFLIVV